MMQPERMCCGCRRNRPKSEMIRVSADGQGNVRVDSRAALGGRGGYLCPELNCIELARKRGGLSRGLKVAVPESIFEEIEQIARGDGDFRVGKH